MGRVYLTRLAGAILVLGMLLPEASEAQQAGSGNKAEKLKNSLYKWRDQNGVVHYSETVPLDHPVDTTEMNKQGRVLKQHQHSAEDRRAAAEKLQKEKDEQAQIAEKRRRDDALLRTYTDVQEIEESRERNVAIPHQAIAGLKIRKEKVQESLTLLHQQAEGYDSKGTARPAGLTDEIDDTKKELAHIAHEIRRYEHQIMSIRNKFDEDKRRFIELKGEAVAADGKS